MQRLGKVYDLSERVEVLREEGSKSRDDGDDRDDIDTGNDSGECFVGLTISPEGEDTKHQNE